MTINLRTSLNTGLNSGLRQSISGGVNGLGFFRAASLDLQFASKKTLNDRVSSSNLITFSRASAGTYVDTNGVIQTAAADTARFDHDPVTGESLGLLIEEARTNLQEHSIVTTSNGWSASNLLLTASQETSPDNSLTGTLITENTSTSTRFFIGSNTVFTSGTTYCNSMFFKAGTLDLVQLTLPGAAFGSSQYANFDLTNGVVTVEVGGTASIEAYPNGWYRCSFAATATSTATAKPGAALINSPTDSRVPSYKGSSRTLYVWGSQVEQGSFPTSHIPTSGSTVTRAAEIAEITGTNFSSFHNASEGTYLIDLGASVGTNSDQARGFVVSSGSNFERIGTNFKEPSSFNLFYSVSNTAVSLADNIPGLPRPIKAAVAYKVGDYRGAYDGQLALTSTVGSTPAVNQLSIGSQNYSSDGYFNGHIKRLAYFPTRLPDATLQNITS